MAPVLIPAIFPIDSSTGTCIAALAARGFSPELALAIARFAGAKVARDGRDGS
jgi:hypothetical protein